MWHVCRKGEVCTRFWWGNLRERDYLGDQDVDRRWEDNIKMDPQEVEGVVSAGWSWLRIGSDGGNL